MDSDWANDPDWHRSISGYLFSLGGGMISWSSKKQQTVAALSCEAEYMAMNHCVKEALWLRSLLGFLGLPQEEATTLFCDNMGTIALTKDALFHMRSKHIDMAHHFVREWVEMNHISFTHLPTHLMPADALTKAVSGPKQVKFHEMMGRYQKGTYTH
jgi:hypothetical protein